MLVKKFRIIWTLIYQLRTFRFRDDLKFLMGHVQWIDIGLCSAVLCKQPLSLLSKRDAWKWICKSEVNSPTNTREGKSKSGWKTFFSFLFLFDKRELEVICNLTIGLCCALVLSHRYQQTNILHKLCLIQLCCSF